MAGERSADEIQRDIEQARAALATAVDQLAYRTNPHRALDSVRANLKAKAATPQGKAVIAGATILLTVLILRRAKR
jgi:hypothetical protein